MSRLLLDYQEFQHYVLNITFPEFGFECSLILTNIPAAAIGYLISMFILWVVANFNLQVTVISLDFPSALPVSFQHAIDYFFYVLLCTYE